MALSLNGRSTERQLPSTEALISTLAAHDIHGLSPLDRGRLRNQAADHGLAPRPLVEGKMLLVTHPRSCGTAIELFLEASGMRVACNLFDRDYYFLRGERGAAPSDAGASGDDRFDSVAQRAISEQGPYLARVAGYTLWPYRSEPLFREFLGSFDHVALLIRDPAYALLSHRALLARSGEELSSTEAGYASLVKLSRFMDREGLPHRIIDAHEVLADPTSSLSFLGAALPSDLTWPAGMRERWGLWRDWKADAAASTSLRAPRHDAARHAEGRQDELYRRCQLAYQYLSARGATG